MVRIRLALYGTKKRPFYKMVVADSRFSRDGRFIEKLGHFNPVSKCQNSTLKLNLNRIEYWQGKGAQISKRSQKLIKLFNKKEDTV
ncbi:30S ribosomal protein S16 [Buchnera aphidicola]|jgi:small subunit ribosomal protein S16|uniref:Small ribosomal subunit protein bS16 n=1 Tax=Buchnera aphidicola subsp. Schizaphis graminum (strain Sg) TaxID=198804 RepID=RS16_BUCAP|nr:30S ribosomal protein S16 [Buchnera aphidicola]Q8K9F6.1 RecName: Full=Small ribosomal subunit protein bS16; AltName: Full=30S ribosomal protein S16 [Buchnera aphidicola str. Sg (Schizaphis graminum)]AAM67933.1 ribosomal protein S16 [Buchnera aphidicola str. Sg (Schizaphis graminum)]AWI49574.1 30S ribosomal protein S16 [Buchnera aphidicola (Schizaphis graminum)]